MNNDLDEAEQELLKLMKTTTCSDERGWSTTLIWKALPELDGRQEALESLVDKGLVTKSGPREFGTVRRYKLVKVDA